MISHELTEQGCGLGLGHLEGRKFRSFSVQKALSVLGVEVKAGHGKDDAGSAASRLSPRLSRQSFVSGLRELRDLLAVSCNHTLPISSTCLRTGR